MTPEQEGIRLPKRKSRKGQDIAGRTMKTTLTAVIDGRLWEMTITAKSPKIEVKRVRSKR